MFVRRLAKNFSSKIKPLSCSKLGKPLGPYSKGIQVNMGSISMLYSAGSIGASLKTGGELISNDVGEQTTLAMDNLKALLEYKYNFYIFYIEKMVHQWIQLLKLLYSSMI